MLKKVINIIVILLISSLNTFSKMDYKPYSKTELSEIIQSQNRIIESLTGKWQFSYDGEEWTNINIPYSEDNDNILYFRRVIKIDKKILENHTWHLYILGIDDELELYINGQFIGNYFSGLAPLNITLNSNVFSHETNEIMLKILPADYGSNQIKKQNIYAKKIRTGIIREIILIGTPNVWVSDIHSKIDLNPSYNFANINVDVKVSAGDVDKFFGSLPDSLIIDKSKFTINISASIIDKVTNITVAQSNSQSIVLQPERTNSLKFNMSLSNPKLWSIDNPSLYKLVVQINKGPQKIDELAVDIGFRDLKIIQDKQGNKFFYLNGKPLILKGVDFIEDYYHTNQTLDAKRIRKDLKNIKFLGANFIRFKYNLPDPYFLNICNQFGIMALIELPIYDVPTHLLISDEIKVRMKNLAQRLFTYYDNNPSIIAYGLYEGLNDANQQINDYITFLMPLFKKNTDNFIYKTINLFNTTIENNNFDFIILRQIGVKVNLNEIKRKIDEWKQKDLKIPIIFNFGLAIQPENHKGYSDPISVQSQSNYLFNLFYISKNNNLAGSLIWTYNDYELENPYLLLNNKNQFGCTSGLVDRYRQQRQSYKTIQTLFNNEKDPVFYAGNYIIKSPVIFIVYGIILAITLVLMINRFKRFRNYLARSITRPYNFYADIRDQRIRATIPGYILGFIIAFTMAIFISSILYLYKTDEATQYILMLIFPIKSVQTFLFKLIWIPELFILMIGMILFLKIFIISFIIKIASLFVRARIFFSDTYTITIWAGTPILFLLPISIFVNKLIILSPNLMWIIILLLLIICLWVFLRILRAIAVVFDIRPLKSYLIGSSLLVAIALITISIYQYKFSLISYFEYLFNVLL